MTLEECHSRIFSLISATKFAYLTKKQYLCHAFVLRCSAHLNGGTLLRTSPKKPSGFLVQNNGKQSRKQLNKVIQPILIRR